jgi:hypothetical protein
LFSTGYLANVVGNIRGVLGEDFLQNFDLLIDYRHKVVRLESVGSSIAETAIGEHLPLELNGTYHGKPTHNRLVVSGHISEINRCRSCWISAANGLILFQNSLELGANQHESVQAGSFNKWIAAPTATREMRELGLGNNTVPNLTVIALSGRADMDMVW